MIGRPLRARRDYPGTWDEIDARLDLYPRGDVIGLPVGERPDLELEELPDQEDSHDD